MYGPYMGPAVNPRVEELFYNIINHTRVLLAYRSSMRPTKTPVIEGYHSGDKTEDSVYRKEYSYRFRLVIFLDWVKVGVGWSGVDC